VVFSLTVGEVVWYEFHRHGSVGEDAEFEIEDESILIHERTETKYLHPENLKKPGWTGGDAEKGKWFFKGVQQGKTKLTIRILFRYDVESECTMTIFVE
jgi:hypothetical protein